MKTRVFYRATREPFSPNEIDKTIVHVLPQDVIKRRGLVPLGETESALQQINLPKKHFHVTEHRVRLYRGPNGEIVKATLPVNIRQAGLFSPRLTALTGCLKARGNASRQGDRLERMVLEQFTDLFFISR